MQKIIVASKNPVKLNSTLNGFNKMFPEVEFSIEGVVVDSEVSDQPIGREETLRGANNRLNNLVKLRPDADYWVGIEGGVEIHDSEMEVSAWVVIRDKNGRIGKGQTGTFILPPKISDLIQSGEELGTATDIVFSKINSKQSGGSISELTDGLVDRTAHYEVGVIFALIPFKKLKLYK